jgi:hypothetical protein
MISFALAIATGGCFVLAILCVVLAPFFATPDRPAWNAGAFLARWALAIGCLSLAVGLLVRVAPATRQPLPWVSLGTTLVTVSWAIVSIGFYVYLTARGDGLPVHLHDRVPLRSPTRRDHPRPGHRHPLRQRSRNARLAHWRWHRSRTPDRAPSTC